uniref:Fibronectin type-III domain-containing protein n=1 Tax=Naja naja TaxID=35670 RepID=A0A8C6XGP6_NAJNA
MDSVRLHWTVPTGRFDSFLVQYKDADGQPQALPVEGGSNEVTVTSLTPSHRYKFNLYGVFGRKRSNPLSTDATTGQFQESDPFIHFPVLSRLTHSEERNPVQPSLGEFSALDITSDSVRLHWTVPTGSFDSFVIQYKDGDGQPQALPVEGGIREVTVTNLAPSRRYKFNLYGVFGRKRSSPLSTDATTVPLVDSKKPVPIQPSLGELSVVDVTSDSVSLYWTVPTGNFDSFLVQYKDADGQPQALPVEGGSNEVTVSNLVPSRRYKFNLYGISGRKRSSPLSTDATTAHLTIIEESIPVQPSLGEFSVLDVTSDSVRLYWTVPTGRFDSFLIQYKDADGQPQALPVEGGFNEVTVSNLVPSRRYKFNLYGVFGRKRSSPLSTDTTTTEEAIPVQPKLGEFSVLDVTSDTVRLHWTVPTGTFDSFLVQYKDADGQPQALPVEKGSKEVTVTDLAPSHRYKFNLYGISGRKRSSPLSTDATTAHIRDSGDPIPIQPSLGEFSVLNVTSDSVRLHWTVPTGTYDSFLIQYKDADGQSQVLPVEGGSNEVTVASLTPSHRYKFNLYVVSGRKRSGPLSTDDPSPAIPIQPTLGELSVLDITSNSVHLYWTVPTGTFDSFLIQYKDADGQPQVLPVDGGLREVTVTNLAPSHRYKFLLYGVSGRKKIHVLSADAFTGNTNALMKPVSIQPNLGELSILDVTSDSVRLHWTIPTGSFDSFLIQYKDADGQLQSLPVEGGSTEVTVTKLVPSRRYEFNLYGISGGKRSIPLSIDATTGELQDTFCQGAFKILYHFVVWLYYYYPSHLFYYLLLLVSYDDITLWFVFGRDLKGHLVQPPSRRPYTSDGKPFSAPVPIIVHALVRSHLHASTQKAMCAGPPQPPCTCTCDSPAVHCVSAHMHAIPLPRTAHLRMHAQFPCRVPCNSAPACTIPLLHTARLYACMRDSHAVHHASVHAHMITSCCASVPACTTPACAAHLYTCARVSHAPPHPCACTPDT